MTDIRHCRAEDLLPTIVDGSVSLVCVDPPYHRVKMDEAWDRQWPTDAAYLEWIGSLCDQFRRVMKPNGSLYLFASPQMAWGVEGEVRKRFNVLTNIRWQKPLFSTKAEMFVKEDLREPFPASETIILAEQCAAQEGITNAEYELNGTVYKVLKDWFRSRAIGITPKEFNSRLGFAITGSGMAGTIIGDKAEFQMPRAEVYAKMQESFPTFDREYEDLRREYEDLRRPFFATADRPYTDVWQFPTVGNYPGKHPCEKPLDMIEHIIEISSRHGDLVLDCFLGSGVTAHACQNLGREFIGCDADEHWVKQSLRRLEGRRPALKAIEHTPERYPLFA